MEVLKEECREGSLIVTLRVEHSEFRRALSGAYLAHADRYPVPHFAPGLAPRTSLEALYGPTALYEEALDICVPETYQQYTEQSEVSVIGKPRLTEVTWLRDGGVSFSVECELYPDVSVGNYKGIEVSVKRSSGEEFAAAVLTKACTEIKAEVPSGMVEQRLNTMLAQEKIRINQDPVYHVLSDSIAILREACTEIGLHLPAAQIQAEALDIMLQTVSKDNKRVTKDYFVNQVKGLIERYRTLPPDIDQVLDAAIEKRTQNKRKMNPDEKADEAFSAYLTTLNLSEAQWKQKQQKPAEDAAKFDLLFQAVAEKEELSVSEDELHTAYGMIAEQCATGMDEIMEYIDPEAVRSQLLRDKARQLILDHAIAISD